MRSRLLLVLFALLWSNLIWAAETDRLSTSQIRAEVRAVRLSLARETDPELRKENLKRLQGRLQLEFEKGAASFDETFVYVNKVLLDIENLLHNDCRKSRGLIVNQTLGADPNLQQRDQIQREMTEGLALHTSYCQAH